MLKGEGWRDNHKRIYRLYREQGLSLRLKRPRRNKSALKRRPQPQGPSSSSLNAKFFQVSMIKKGLPAPKI